MARMPLNGGGCVQRVARPTRCGHSGFSDFDDVSVSVGDVIHLVVTDDPHGVGVALWLTVTYEATDNS